MKKKKDILGFGVFVLGSLLVLLGAILFLFKPQINIPSTPGPALPSYKTVVLDVGFCTWTINPFLGSGVHEIKYVSSFDEGFLYCTLPKIEFLPESCSFLDWEGYLDIMIDGQRMEKVKFCGPRVSCTFGSLVQRRIFIHCLEKGKSYNICITLLDNNMNMRGQTKCIGVKI